jgi:para-nitrobenzyl esterase
VLPGNFLFPTPSFAPLVDGNVLPQHPFDPVASPLSAAVPLLIGSNRTELSLWDLGNEGVRSSDEAVLQATIGRLLTGRSREVIEGYRHSFPTASSHELAVLIQTDLYYGVPTKMLAARKVAQGGAPAYVYRFDWETPVLDGQLHSPHALEVPFVFDNVEIAKEFTGGGAAAATLAAAISDAWIAFARTGNPAVSTLPSWPAYEVDRRETMVFKAASTVVADPDRTTRALMESILATA